jgi:hypothetical protein
VALRLRGTLLVASSAPDFYGNVAAGAMIRARHLLGPRTWLSLALDAATYRYVANAVVTSNGWGFGPPTLGLHQLVVAGTGPSAPAVSVYARALLPLDTARASGVETGLEVGSAVRFAPRPRLGIEGGVAVAAPLDVTAGQAHAALRPAALVEAWVSPLPYLALFAGAEGRAEVTPDPTFLSIAPRLAARFALRHGVWLALLAEVPVAGADRTDLVAGLYGGWAP